MYSYYLLCILLGKDSKARAKYLFWGRYLTQFQMAQFVTNMVQAKWCLQHSPYPSWLSDLLFKYMITLLLLFGAFYYRKHIATAAEKKAARKAAAAGGGPARNTRSRKAD